MTSAANTILLQSAQHLHLGGGGGGGGWGEGKGRGGGIIQSEYQHGGGWTSML